MTVQSIGPCAAVLSLTPTELTLRGWSPVALTRKQALALLWEAGVALPGRVEIDTFPGRREVLVFARWASDTVWFAFDTLEGLMAAALALRSISPQAQLWWHKGRYWLGLPPGEAEVCRAMAAGEEARPGPMEKGRLIFPQDAVGELLRQFLRLHI